MKLSVVIPAYNAGAYIRETVESVLPQTPTGGLCGVIVCDDRSLDDTAQIVQAFTDCGLDYLLNATNLGPAGNFNRCLDVASGEYVCLFHADDVMLPGNLARKVAVLDANPGVGLVHSNAVYIDAEGRETGIVHQGTVDAVRPGREAFREWLLGDNTVVAPSVVMRRSVVEKVGRFETGITHTQDLNFWLRMAAAADVAYLSEPLIRYRQHPTQDTKRYGAARLIREDFLARGWACERLLREGGGTVPASELRDLLARSRTKYAVRALNGAEGALADGNRPAARELLRLAREISWRQSWSAAGLRLLVKSLGRL